jgi:hypothetical protein
VRLVMVLLLSSVGLAQQSNTTSAPCSPIAPNNSGSITISCPGMSKEQGQKMIDILNKILANRVDTNAVMEKLDGCLAGVNQIVEKEAPRHITAQQQESIVRAISQFKGQRIGTVVNNSKRENLDYFNELKDVLVAAGWDVYERGIMISGQEPLGVVITVGEKDRLYPAVQALVNAFEAAGIVPVAFYFQPASDPDSKYLLGKIKAGEILLQVGDKP